MRVRTAGDHMTLLIEDKNANRVAKEDSVPLKQAHFARSPVGQRDLLDLNKAGKMSVGATGRKADSHDRADEPRESSYDSAHAPREPFFSSA